MSKKNPVFSAITEGNQSDYRKVSVPTQTTEERKTGKICTDHDCNKTEPCGHKRCGFPGAGE